METNCVDTKIESVMTRPRDQALQQAWIYIGKNNQRKEVDGMLVCYRVGVYSLDGAAILEYRG